MNSTTEGRISDSPATETHCLNLHERYAPDWGVWECARELFANAKDASPDEMRIESPNANTLTIYTPTAPDFGQLFIIGCGSKDPNDENIGQFGEGVKLAALVAARKVGASLTIRLAASTITFAIREHFGQSVLFADVTPSDPFDGCLCTLVMDGAGYALVGKTIDGGESHPIPKAPDAPMQIFCKGIWICNVDEKDAIFSYNLNDIKLNRDRSHADPFSIRYAIGRLLDAQMSDKLATRLIKNMGSYETEKALDAIEWSCSEATKQALAAAVVREYGEKAVLRTGSESMLAAMNLGYKTIPAGAALLSLLGDKVQRDIDVIAKRAEFEELPWNDAWTADCLELARLSLITGIGSEVKVYADNHGDILGKADSDGNIIWLNERLFHPDNRFERIRTYIHELGHLQGGGHDATQRFEASLDLIGGTLALYVLDNTGDGTK